MHEAGLGLDAKEVRHFRLNEPLLWLVPLLLSALGIVMIASTTSGLALDAFGTPFAHGYKQMNWLVVALAGMVLTCTVPLDAWRSLSGVFWLLAILLTFMTLVPPFGVSGGGAHRWFHLGPLRFQPSEILALAVVIHVSKKLDDDSIPDKKMFVRCGLIALLSMFPLLLQPNMGSAIMILLLVMGLFVERRGWHYPLMGAATGLLLSIPLVLMKSYRLRRIRALIDPWSDPLDSGFQVIQGLVAFANGGFWGLGVGHGLQKLQYLPEAHTDFIFSAIGEELGVIGTLSVFILLFLWFWRARSVYNRMEESFERSLLWGLVLAIILPILINIGGVTKVIPLTGLPFTFVSYGGSSLVMMWMRVGILLRLAKEAPHGEAAS